MERTNVVTVGGTPVTLVGEEIKVGMKAPDFTALDIEMNPVKLSDFKGKNVVISSALSVDTGVCATQTRTFNQAAAKLDDTVILAISADLPYALGRFCGAEGIDAVKAVSDYKDLDFAMKYGFLIKEFRLLERGVVIVDKEGTVQYVEYLKETVNEPDYDAALEALSKL